MAEKELKIINERLVNPVDGEMLFRSNSGIGWQGKIGTDPRSKKHILTSLRPFRAMPEGWPDLTGWQTIEITPDMIGKKIAVFKGVEVKTKNVHLSKQQKAVKKWIEDSGGIYEELRG
jgi:hypothetical protein